MTLPSFLFGTIIASLVGALFHLLLGGGLGRILVFLIFGWVGFWIGHIIGAQFDWTFANLGPLNLIPALIGCVMTLMIAHWLSQPQSTAQEARQK